MQVLVTGGAGYIGSHTSKELAGAGYEPIVLDNFQNGHRWAVRWGPLLEIDLSDRQGLRRGLAQYQIDTVIHLAGVADVGESMRMPAKYFRSNLVNTLNLLDAMGEAGIANIIFSSSCATYGAPTHMPVAENHPQHPTSPYGESKLIIERVLRWYGHAYGIAWTALRYFNAAGSDPAGEIGEDHYPETHLIPRAIAAACGDISELEILGTDYDTVDGTAVRDYIHVTDLASAHLKAMSRLHRGRASIALNLGTGHGYSVLEVVAKVEQTARRKITLKTGLRRDGDPAVLVADAALAKLELNWTAEHSSLDSIIQTAWHWHSRSQMSVKREGIRIDAGT